MYSLLLISINLLLLSFFFVRGGVDCYTYEDLPEKYLIKNKFLLKFFLKSPQIAKSKILKFIFAPDVKVTKYFAVSYLIHFFAFCCVFILYVIFWINNDLVINLLNDTTGLIYLTISVCIMLIAGAFHLILSRRYIHNKK